MTFCKNGHILTPETIDATRASGYKRCRTCRNEYQKQYRFKTKDVPRSPIADWEAKDSRTTPIYFPEAILNHGKNASWYERSRQQMKLLASHKYAVRGPSART